MVLTKPSTFGLGAGKQGSGTYCRRMVEPFLQWPSSLHGMNEVRPCNLLTDFNTEAAVDVREVRGEGVERLQNPKTSWGFRDKKPEPGV